MSCLCTKNGITDKKIIFVLLLTQDSNVMSKKRKKTVKTNTKIHKKSTDTHIKSSKKRTYEKLITASVILIACFILYGNTIPFGYTFDDKIVVTRNESTKAGFGGIKDILTRDAFSNYFGKKQNLVSGGRYRPLAAVTFALEWEFFAKKNEAGEEEGNPHISHIINILLYAFCCYLIFLIMSKILKNYNARSQLISISFVSAIIFAAHPVHTEVVANIKGRDEIMALIGSLSTVWLSIKYLETNKIKYIIWSGIVFFLSLMSKENSVTFIAVIPVLAYIFYKSPIKKCLVLSIPLIISLIIFMVIRHNILGDTTKVAPELMNNPFLEADTEQKYATIFLTWGHYLRLLFFPYTLTYDYYPYHISLTKMTNPVVWGILAVYGAFVFIAIKGLIKRTLTGFALILYLATFSIVSNFFFPIGAFMNERFIFFSSLAFAILAAYFFSLLINKTGKTVAIAILTTVLGLYSIKTISRNRVWESDYTLFTTDVKTSEGSAFGNLTAGKQYLFKAGKLENEEEKEKYLNLAIKHLTKAVTIHEEYANGLFFLSEAYFKYKKDIPKTIEYLERLVKLTPAEAEINYRLGALIGKYTKDRKKSIYYLERTKKLDPKHKMLNKTLGALYFNERMYKKSLNCFLEHIKTNPDDVEIYKHLSVIYAKLNNEEMSQKMEVKYNLMLKKEKNKQPKKQNNAG